MQSSLPNTGIEWIAILVYFGIPLQFAESVVKNSKLGSDELSSDIMFSDFKYTGCKKVLDSEWRKHSPTLPLCVASFAKIIVNVKKHADQIWNCIGVIDGRVRDEEERMNGQWSKYVQEEAWFLAREEMTDEEGKCCGFVWGQVPRIEKLSVASRISMLFGPSILFGASDEEIMPANNAIVNAGETARMDGITAGEGVEVNVMEWNDEVALGEGNVFDDNDEVNVMERNDGASNAVDSEEGGSKLADVEVVVAADGAFDDNDEVNVMERNDGASNAVDSEEGGSKLADVEVVVAADGANMATAGEGSRGGNDNDLVGAEISEIAAVAGEGDLLDYGSILNPQSIVDDEELSVMTNFTHTDFTFTDSEVASIKDLLDDLTCESSSLGAGSPPAQAKAKTADDLEGSGNGTKLLEECSSPVTKNKKRANFQLQETTLTKEVPRAETASAKTARNMEDYTASNDSTNGTKDSGGLTRPVKKKRASDTKRASTTETQSVASQEAGNDIDTQLLSSFSVAPGIPLQVEFYRHEGNIQLRFTLKGTQGNDLALGGNLLGSQVSQVLKSQPFHK